MKSFQTKFVFVYALFFLADFTCIAQQVDAQQTATRQETASQIETGLFQWRASEPFLALDAKRLPESADNPWLAVKDPTIVRHDDRWHLFCTLRKTNGGDGKPPGYIRVGYLSFSDWKDAQSADWQLLDLSMGYHGAPQVFYFEPHKKWYLVYQLEDADRGIKYGPCFSTTANIADPKSWSAPKPMYAEKPSNVKGWLDFWVICDDQTAHLFFTSLNGTLWRAETSLNDFPNGFDEPRVALKGNFFEASHTYRVKGTDTFLMFIEAQKESKHAGRRFFKAWKANKLDGDWTPLSTSAEKPFAGTTNVTMPDLNWTDSISHGEIIRAGINQKLEIDPQNLRVVFQGLKDDQWGKGYGKLGWRLGILTQVEK